MTRAALVTRLEALGIRAVPVLEADEVLQQAVLVARRSVCEVESDGECVPVFAAPLGMPVVRPRRMASLGEDSMQWNEP
jgi:crotonobetainyl-CoA:carnitine CoA-transferase CaiB-like acyl-CoA transferase